MLTKQKICDSHECVMCGANMISLKDFENAKSRIIKPNCGDIGYDLIAHQEPNIIGAHFEKDSEIYYSHVDYIEYKTGIFIQPQNKKLYSLVFRRSSISTTRLSLANSVGVIDTSYTGEILCRFRYNYSPKDFKIFNDRFYFMIDEDKIYHAGDKIAQLVFIEKTNVDFKLVDELSLTSRNDGGFGSTGK